MKFRKRTEGFNLAFLDIMACGLGAVILVLMIVKQKVDEAPIEVDNLKQDISQLEQVQSEALLTLRELEAAKQSQQSRQAALQAALREKQSILARQSESFEGSQAELAQLKSAITDIKVPDREDLVETQQVNEENYLLGLRVEGRKIAILVDISASMTNEKLIDIIQTKSRSTQVKQQAPKWLRTKKTVEWLLARLPAESEVVVVAFSDEATVLGGNASWRPGNSQTVNAIMAELNTLVPQGATNLQKGLDTLNTFSPSNLYVVTDGLPTKGESRYRSLNPFASCSSLTGSAATISGDCRVKLFQQTITESGRRDIQVDVILLPLEGDPDAFNQYWSWAAVTGGLVISPAGNWP